MTKDEIILANKEYLFPAVFHFFQEPLVVARAKDQYVWDADGKQYLDFLGGIVTVSVGHCNQEVNAKVHRQMDTLQEIVSAGAGQLAPAPLTAQPAAPNSSTRSGYQTRRRQSPLASLPRQSPSGSELSRETHIAPPFPV